MADNQYSQHGHLHPMSAVMSLFLKLIIYAKIIQPQDVCANSESFIKHQNEMAQLRREIQAEFTDEMAKKMRKEVEKQFRKEKNRDMVKDAEGIGAREFHRLKDKYRVAVEVEYRGRWEAQLREEIEKELRPKIEAEIRATLEVEGGVALTAKHGNIRT